MQSVLLFHQTLYNDRVIPAGMANTPPNLLEMKIQVSTVFVGGCTLNPFLMILGCPTNRYLCIQLLCGQKYC